MTQNDICQKAKSLAEKKTIYLKKCNGLKMTQPNKLKMSSIDPFNAKKTEAIFAATEDTEGYDEFTFVKAVTGITISNFVDAMSQCTDISKDFSAIVPGELVFGSDRIGIYIGDYEIITIDPVKGVVKVDGANGFVSHGKLASVDYAEEVKNDTQREVVRDVERTEPATTEEIKSSEERNVEIRSDRARRRDRMH
jgi:hypothetical protein